jgi:hypothetical protein
MPLEDDEVISGLDLILPWLVNLHVFNWSFDFENNKHIRHALAEGAEKWCQYLAKVIPAKPKYALLEFIRDNSEDQLRADAKTLNNWLNKL